MSNKKKVNIIWILVPILLLIVLGFWRLVPRPFSKLIPADAAMITEIDAGGTDIAVEEGILKMDTYSASLSAKEEGSRAILELLDASGYRPDLRNLLPFLLKGLISAGGTKNAHLLLKWGSGESCRISVLSDSQVLVSDSTGAGSRLYHSVDKGLIDRLSALIRENKQ